MQFRYTYWLHSLTSRYLLIFGRRAVLSGNGTLADEFAAAFAGWNDHSLKRSALAHNLKFDDRVPEAKAESLQEVLEEGQKLDAMFPSPYTLLDALIEYKKSRCSRPVDPEFLDERKNVGNLPLKRPGAKWLPPTGVELVRILDLNRLIPLFQKDWLTGSRDPEFFEEFRSVPTTKGYHKWLTTNIEQGNPRPFLEKILQLLNEDLSRSQKDPGPDARVFPCWASVAYDAPEDDLTRWCQLAGISVSAPTWFCLLKYSAERAGTPVRPTQLEAGAEFMHFPTPGKSAWTSGGHPVEIHSDAVGRRLPREFLHYPIRIDPADLVDWKLVEPYSFDLVAVRDRHMERLKREYWLTWEEGWMNEHVSSRYRVLRERA
jgi:hypothetical protein